MDEVTQGWARLRRLVLPVALVGVGCGCADGAGGVDAVATAETTVSADVGDSADAGTITAGDAAEVASGAGGDAEGPGDSAAGDPDGARVGDVATDALTDAAPDALNDALTDTSSDADATTADSVSDALVDADAAPDALSDADADAGKPDAAPADAALTCIDGMLLDPTASSEFHLEHCQGVPCACPKVPYPDGSACCPECLLACDYPTCCDSTNQYHCKYGKWQINTWYNCAVP